MECISFLITSFDNSDKLTSSCLVQKKSVWINVSVELPVQYFTYAKFVYIC